MQENNLPGGRVFTAKLVDKLNKSLEQIYKTNKIIVSNDNYQLHLNHGKLEAAKIASSEILAWLKKELSKASMNERN